MNSFFDQAKNWWEERSFGQRFTLIFLIAAFVGVVTYLFAVSNQPDWDVAFDNLSPSSAASVASHLKENGIIHRISNDGKTILVPKEVKREIVMEVEAEDLITDGHIGLEALSNMPIGLTTDQGILWRKRMIQGELARTIESIKGVKKAKIQIAQPEKSVFSADDEHSSASVMLTLSPGFKLKQDHIKAIKNLVSHAVPGMQPSDVFVTNQNGISLTDDIQQTGSTLDDLRASFEKKTEKKVKEVLSKLVGHENVTVAVTAEINFDKTTSKIERFIPTTQTSDGSAAGVLISEQVNGEKYTGEDKKAPGGVPGTDSNITNPSYVANSGGDASGKSSNYDKNSTIKNFEVSKEIKNIVYAPGQVQRLTVAVAVNKNLTTKEQENIEQLVRTAAGADIARGDTITVTGMAFAYLEDMEEKKAALAKQAEMDKIYSAVEIFGPYVAIFIFGGVALMILYSLIKRPVQAVEVEQYEEPEFELPEQPDILEAASIPVIEAKLDPEIERMREEINNFVMSDAAEAARLLLTFIKE